MDRIGILTFQFAHNYGALLQAYALKRSLTDESTSVEIINYMPIGLWENYSINPIYAFKKRQLKNYSLRQDALSRQGSSLIFKSMYYKLVSQYIGLMKMR